MKQMVESTYGHDIIVTGANYPPSQSQVIIAQGTQALWFVGLGLVFAGDVIFKALGFKEPPQFFQQAKENKMMVLGGLWFLNNWGNTQLSTGAFEMYLDDELIYSKLGSGQVPTGDMIIQMLQNSGLKT